MSTYRVVRGVFELRYDCGRIVGSKPEGDSVWFKPDDPARLRTLGGRSAKLNKGGCARLRFEAIDALEIHFGKTHQQLAWARAARDRLLETALGFECVDYGGTAETTVKTCTPDSLRGHLLTKSVDPQGRPVAFVFKGDPAETEADGAEVSLGLARLKRSVNARLLADGLVYPAFYTGLEDKLRDALAASATAARDKLAGLWPEDLTRRGAKATGIAELEAVALWPKLFRRLVSYYDDGAKDPYAFTTWLREEPADRDDSMTVLSTGKSLRLSDVVKIYRNKASLAHNPEDLVVVPR